MEFMFTLQALLIAAAGVLALMVILAAHSRWKKMVAIVFFVTIGSLGFASYLELLGKPKPIDFAYLSDKGDGITLVSSHMVEGEAIYLWTKSHLSQEPISYVLPWHLETAKKLQKAKRQSQANGNPVQLKKLGKGNDSSQGEWTFHVAPPKPLPEKSEG